LHSPRRTIETDVCVVGGGLVGVAHALAARRRGLGVVLLEQDARALGASVRHAGHLFFTALAAADADALAPHARELWLELARRAGTQAGQDGTVILARGGEELAVMEALASQNPSRARMLTRREAVGLVPAAGDGILGALLGTSDLLVDPRLITAALTRLLAADTQARVEFRAQAHAAGGGMVEAGPLRVRAPCVIVCPGAGSHGLLAALPAGDGLVSETVQLLRVAAPRARRLGPAITTAIALLEHPVLAGAPGAEALRARLELEHPAAVEAGVAPLLTPLAAGGMIVSQTRSGRRGRGPYRAERLDTMLHGAARQLLGCDCEVRERWTLRVLRDPTDAAGTRDFRIGAPAPGVRVVRALSQRALALCHVQAERTLAELIDQSAGAPVPAPPALTVTDLRAHADAFRSRPRR
jgi:FAD dependent oxidoreductase TIGR03364